MVHPICTYHSEITNVRNQEIQGQPMMKMYDELRARFNSVRYEVQNQIKENNKQTKEHEFEKK